MFFRYIASFLVAAYLAFPSVDAIWSGRMPEQHIRDDGRPPCVFVGGLISYGERTAFWHLLPTFGIWENVPRMLEAEGYECYVSSPGTFNSNWDRACNLYAELMGTVVDYGEAHAKAHGHARYGFDYREPLVPDWGPERPINLLGHSVGGPTVYYFAHLMAQGCQAEREATEDGSLSPLFSGGQSDLIHSVTGLAGTFNGVSAASPFFGAGSFTGDNKAVVINRTGILDSIWAPAPPPENPSLFFQYSRFRDILNFLTTGDQMFYDLSPGGAAEKNRGMETAEDIYYFSYSLCDSKPDKNGNWVMDIRNLWAGLPLPTGPVVYFLGNIMGSWRSDGYVYGGGGGPFTLDEAWRANDGMANTITELYPFGQPNKEYDPENLERGTWQVMPTMHGYTHGFFGGFDFKYTPDDLFDFYMGHMRVLEGTYASAAPEEEAAPEEVLEVGEIQELDARLQDEE